MTFTPPTPPTPPAPAIRPTPPTPPRIDMTPYGKKSDEPVNEPVDENFSEEVTDEPVKEPVEETSDEPVEETQEPVDKPTQENFPVTRKVDDPESMARDAVANGVGPLTKRTVERGDQTQQNQQPAQIEDTQSDYDRGQDVLRQFREEDARATQQPQENFQPQTVTETPRTFKPTINYHEGHGGVFWLATIIFVALVSFVVVKKFLLTDKPALTKSDIFADSTDRLKAAADKVKQPARPSPTPVTKPKSTPVTKPAPLPVTKPARPSLKKDDDDKSKHFEIRI